MSYSEAGKGSAPRKQQDLQAYSEGWDRIFGKKKVNSDELTIIEVKSGKEMFDQKRNNLVKQLDLKLCGSRYFNAIDPEIVPVTEHTDYDYFVQANSAKEKVLEEAGFKKYNFSSYSLDDQVVSIWSYVSPEGYRMQVIMRKNEGLYQKVIGNIPPWFYQKYLWKSGPFANPRQQIQDMFNLLYRIAQ